MDKQQEEAMILELFKFEDRARFVARIKVGAILILLGISVCLILYGSYAIHAGVLAFYGVN